MNYSIIKNPISSLILPLGATFLSPNLDSALIEEKLIIEQKKQYGFWSKKLLKALNTGLISQVVYDIIKDNENEARQYYTISLDVNISKGVLLSIIDPFKFEFIEADASAIDILTLLNENEYQIIKK